MIHNNYSIASKVFIIGEYLALMGGPAVVGTVSPRFEIFKSLEGPGPFHPDSPAGRLFQKLEMKQPSMQFIDPYRGKGGMGGSVAEFALSYKLLLETHPSFEQDVQSVWRMYRELNPVASGYDLIAQWVGGVHLISEVRPHEVELKNLSSFLGSRDNPSPLLLFSATEDPRRKTKTHEHLAEIGVSGLLEDRELRACLLVEVEEAVSALIDQDWSSLGSRFHSFSETLRKYDLECSATREDRLRLSELDFVLGVKGLGANLSDGLIVLSRPNVTTEERRELIRICSARGLSLVSSGLHGSEVGITSREEVGR